MDKTLAITSDNDQLARVGAQDPATAFMYEVQNYISLSNVPMGFDFKHGDFRAEFMAQVTTVRALNAHAQPDPQNPQDAGKPLHRAPVQWCQSFDNKRTNTLGENCEGCPAFAVCRAKLEMTLQLPDEEQLYLLTAPEVSRYRFRDAAQALARTHGKHFSQVIWKISAEPRDTMNGKQKIRHAAMVFVPCDPETGEMLLAKKQENARQQPVAPQDAVSADAPVAPRVLIPATPSIINLCVAYEISDESAFANLLPAPPHATKGEKFSTVGTAAPAYKSIWQWCKKHELCYGDKTSPQDTEIYRAAIEGGYRHNVLSLERLDEIKAAIVKYREVLAGTKET